MKAIRLLSLCLLSLLLPATLSAATFKIATAAPEGSSWMREMRAGAIEIKQRTDDRVKIKFFAGGVMGNDKSVLRKMRVGQLHGGAFISGSLYRVAPDVNLFSLPLIFRSYAEIDYVRSRMDADLKQAVEKAGFVCFGFAEGGFALLMSQQPVWTIDDVRGRKIWVPEGDTVSYRVMESLGLAPVTLPITDVMTGLQAGLIEVIASSPIGALAFQWHTRIKYVTNTPLIYLYATMAIDKKAFFRISSADQQTVREVMENIYARIDRANRIDNEAAIQAMVDTGIKFVDMTDDEVAKWRGIAGGAVDEMHQEGFFSAELYGRLQSLLEQYRNGQVAAQQ
jgi:TRAP-type C4-dicarboxylate transport system substrate-binding protein